MENPLTPAGMEPATFRFVSQQLNHCATAVPVPLYSLKIYAKKGSPNEDVGCCMQDVGCCMQEVLS